MPTIEVKEKQIPRVPCPHCHKMLSVNLLPFQDDVTKVLESKCPYCFQTLFTAMTLLTHKNLNGLMETLQAMFVAVNTVGRADFNRAVVDAAHTVQKKNRLDG